MTNRDKTAFAELMVGLGEAYGEAISKPRLEIYYRALEDLDLQAIQQAATIHVRTQKFFPRPAEIREAVEGSVDDAAEVAWTTVLSLVRRYGYPGTDGRGAPPAFPNEATRRAAMDLYGSWFSLCERLPGSGPELLGVRKAFLASFASHARVRRLELPPATKDEAKALLGGLKQQLEQRGLPAGGL